MLQQPWLGAERVLEALFQPVAAFRTGVRLTEKAADFLTQLDD
jgi:hypothetical protein